MFACNWKLFKWYRGLACVIIALIAGAVLGPLGKDQYLITVVFGAVYTAASARGGAYGYVVRYMAGYALVGAGLTALGFWIATVPWAWIAFSALVVTLAAGVPARYGAHGLADGLFLDTWYLIAMGLSAGYHAARTPQPGMGADARLAHRRGGVDRLSSGCHSSR